MGTKKFDKLEVYIRGTENVDWEGRDPGKFGLKIAHQSQYLLEFCILSVRNGHFGKTGEAIEVDGNQTGCVAWTNTYGVPPGTKKWKKKHNFSGKL